MISICQNFNELQVLINKMSCKNKEELFKSEFKKSMDFRKLPIFRKKGKRFRSAFTTEQLTYLESVFEKNPYIGHDLRKEVATALNITEKSIKVWFQNRRMREKNMYKELDIDDDDDDNYCGNYMTLSNDQFSNVHDAPSTSNQNLFVLPLMTSTDTIYNVNNMNTVVTEDKKNQEHLKMSFFNEISLNHEKGPIEEADYKLSSPVLRTQNAPGYEASAEFSINLCKKYKNALIQRSEQEKSPISETPISQAMASNSRYLNHEQDVAMKEEPKTSPEIEPEDLSHKAKRRSQSDIKSPNSPQSKSRNNFAFQPVYVAQPYLPATNMMWKPINIMPVLTAGASGVSISTDNSEAAREQTGPKKPCNCECHAPPPPEVKPISPETNQKQQPQYIITAVPFPNFPKF